MDKNILLAIVLSVAVLFGYQFLISEFIPQPPVMEQAAPKADQKTQESPATPQPGAPTTQPTTAPAQQPAPVAAIPVKPALTAEVPEKEITVDTDLYHAVFSTNGAVIKSFVLKKHTDEKGAPLNAAIALNPDANKPLALLSGGRPVYASFQASADKITLSSANSTASLAFTYSDASGLAVEKKFTFHNDGYRIDLDMNLQGGSDYKLALGAGFGITGKEAPSMGVHVGPVVMVQGKRESEDTIKLAEAPKTYTGGIAWAAVEDKYFMAGLVPLSQIGAVEARAAGKGDAALPDVTLSLAGNGPVTAKFLLYAGPKEYDRLAALKVGLEDIVDYGWFKLFAKPMFHFMNMLYRVFGNYGVAIIILTVIIKVVFIPLTHKSTKSMKEMQRVQPELTKLREKHKNDSATMNKEMMELYKKHKINPLGGCLPMVLQIPVFIALYNVLLVSIELRHAPFFWWLKDLSAPDGLIQVFGFPVGPLPILMGASMFVMQKMTPTTITDPMQQKIMLYMPLVFSLMFFTFPSGLVLYWLVNNTLQIAQQYVTNKYIK